MTTPQPPIVKWNAPNTCPAVRKGSEKLFWLAVKNPMGVHVFPAHFQNRPLVTDEMGNLVGNCDEWVLTSPDGDYVDSFGWVDCKSHSEFDDYYEKLEFNNDCKLLGWAEYQAPTFTGVVA